MASEAIPQWLLVQLVDGRAQVSAAGDVSAIGATGTTTIAAMAGEILRLRGIIEGARHYVAEDLQAHAYAILCGMGLEDGIDPSLDHTPHGARLIHAFGAEGPVAELEEARDALGRGWLAGGVSLAEGIRRGLEHLEELAAALEKERDEARAEHQRCRAKMVDDREAAQKNSMDLIACVRERERRIREHAALLETAQKALAETKRDARRMERERDEMGEALATSAEDRARADRAEAMLASILGPQQHLQISVREAARRRRALDGADAQALEGALQITERERDAALARIEAAGRVISEIGCECVCGHPAANEDHDDDCEPCHLCRIEDALQPEGRG